MHLLLLGDSLLAEVGSDRTVEFEQRLPGWVVLNCATSGFTAAQSRRQRELLAPIRPTAVFVSLGTNDSVVERAVDVDAFERDLVELLAAFPDARAFVLLPPGIDEDRQQPCEGRTRTNEGVDRFREAAARAAAAAGAEAIDGRDVLATVRGRGQEPLVADGVHLTDATYVALAEELAGRLR